MYSMFSEEYLRLYGLRPGDPPLTLEELPRRTHPDDRERVQAHPWEALEHAHAWEIEYRVLWPDGSVHWLHSKGAVFPDSFGRPVRSTGVIFDITERKRVEAALRRAKVAVSGFVQAHERRYRLLQDAFRERHRIGLHLSGGQSPV